MVLAANRDEYLDRPSEGPAIREAESGSILMPLDVRAGGTWLGLNQWGVFCGLTNLSGLGNESHRRSRGQVVMSCLAAVSAAAAVERLMALPKDLYNPFNSFICDRTQAFLVSYSGTPDVQELEPGVCVVGNANALAPPVPKVARLQDEVRGLAEGPSENLLEKLGDLCRKHGVGDGALDETCVHLADTYGTRSSMLLELGDASGASALEPRVESRLFYADGPPCSVEYKNLSPLLLEFERMPNRHAAEFLTRTAS